MNAKATLPANESINLIMKNKTILITGGTTGIGLATAKLLNVEGAKIIVTGRNPETLAAVQREPALRASSSCFRPVVRLDSQAIPGSPPVGLMPSLSMFFAALTSASKMLPQLVQTKRDRLMRLAASTTMIRDPYQGALYSSMVRIIRGDTSSSDRFWFACFWTS